MDIPIPQEKSPEEEKPKTDEINVQVFNSTEGKKNYNEFLERDDGGFSRVDKSIEVNGEPLTTERRGILDTEANEANWEDESFRESSFNFRRVYSGVGAVIKKPVGFQEEEKNEDRVVEGIDFL